MVETPNEALPGSGGGFGILGPNPISGMGEARNLKFGV